MIAAWFPLQKMFQFCFSPKTRQEGKFGMHFCLALARVEKELKRDLDDRCVSGAIESGVNQILEERAGRMGSCPFF